MNMRTRSRTGPKVALSVVLAMLAASCSGDVTESEEYLELQSELDTQAEEIQTIQGELEDSRTRETELNSELEVVRSEIGDLTADLEEASNRAAEAEAELDDYINRPWPDPLKEMFVVGCTDTPNEGLTDEQETELCSCVVDELEQTVTLDDFMVFSTLAFASEGSGAVNPLTGFPSGLDDELAEIIIDAGTRCVLSLENRRILAARGSPIG